MMQTAERTRFTEAEMATVRDTDLPDLLISLGYQVKRIGRYYTTQEMDSIRIKDRRTWFRYSEGIGGDAITFLQRFYNKSFPEAVEYLLTWHGRARDPPPASTPRQAPKKEEKVPFSIRGEQKVGARYTSTSDPRYRVEMVTPKLTYAELPKFQECVRRVRTAGGKVNSSCGIHIHVDAANHNRQSLKNLIGIMYSKEDILFKALQVNESRASRWCQKVREPMLQKARKLSSEETKNLTQLEAIWYEGDNGSTEHYNWTRYYALNLHSVFYRGTVEFRCFNSTLHAGRAAAYVNLCLAISAQAIAQRSTVMRKTQSDNELFTFRVWLVRLGLNGPEFKHTRDHLLANLDGDRAWRYDKDSYDVNKKKKNRSSEVAR